MAEQTYWNNAGSAKHAFLWNAATAHPVASPYLSIFSFYVSPLFRDCPYGRRASLEGARKNQQWEPGTSETARMTQTNTFKLIAPRFTLPALTLSLLAFGSGCTIRAFDDLPDTSASSSGGRASTGGSSSEDAPAEDEGPVTVPFEKLVVQTVQWFDKDVTIEKAETTTTRANLLGEVHVDREHKITLMVQNRTQGSSELEYEKWDLILADGTRLKSNVQENFGPKDVHRFGRSFSGDEHALEGAHFELNEYTYGEYEPLILPLDRLVEKMDPVLSLDSVVGQSVMSDSEDSGWKYEILSARIAMNSEIESDHRPGTRAKVGKKLLELVVRSTNLDSAARNLSDSYFHLMVDGYGVSSNTFVNELPDGGAKLDIPVVFQIDAIATELDIEFVVERTESVWKSIHVDLANATPIE